jgi:hypothetical protein
LCRLAALFGASGLKAERPMAFMRDISIGPIVKARLFETRCYHFWLVFSL